MATSPRMYTRLSQPGPNPVIVRCAQAMAESKAPRSVKLVLRRPYTSAVPQALPSRA